METYKFGIITRRRIGDRYRNIAICACGQHIIGDNIYRINECVCNKCRNSYFIEVFKGEGRYVIPYLKSIRKDNRGFIVERTNLSVIYGDGFLKPVRKNIVRKMKYDIVDKELKVWRNGELEYDYSTDGNRSDKINNVNKVFFTSLNNHLFIEFISNDTTRGLYKIAESISFNNRSYRGRSGKANIMNGLTILMENYQWMQILANAGIPEVNRFYRRRYAWNRSKEFINTEETRPHKILGVPRFMMQHIREDLSIDYDVLERFQGHLERIDNNKLREIMSIAKDEGSINHLSRCLDTIMQIHIDYGYKNIKQLILYVFRETRLYQGIGAIESSTLLRDYIRMSRHMELEHERYPKSLKKEHDITLMNYKVLNDNDEKNKLFKMSIDKESYKSLAYMEKDEKYAMLLPENPQELISEGNQLSHCIASYVDDVISDKCKILFLRNNDSTDEPLVSVEVRGFNIRQARGFANRVANKEEREFIKLWAEEKGLIEAYY